MPEGDDLFLRGSKALDERRNKDAYALFIEAAKKGNVLAMNSIGFLLDHGIGVRRDHRSALYWYYKGAKAGDTCAVCNVGLSHKKNGNFRGARIWLLRALAMGDGDAAYDLAEMYSARGRNQQAERYLQTLFASKSATEASVEKGRKLLRKIKRATDKRRNKT